jgi:hypothetical protein
VLLTCITYILSSKQQATSIAARSSHATAPAPAVAAKHCSDDATQTDDDVLVLTSDVRQYVREVTRQQPGSVIGSVSGPVLATASCGSVSPFAGYTFAADAFCSSSAGVSPVREVTRTALQPSSVARTTAAAAAAAAAPPKTAAHDIALAQRSTANECDAVDAAASSNVERVDCDRWQQQVVQLQVQQHHHGQLQQQPVQQPLLDQRSPLQPLQQQGLSLDERLRQQQQQQQSFAVVPSTAAAQLAQAAVEQQQQQQQVCSNTSSRRGSTSGGSDAVVLEAQLYAAIDSAAAGRTEPKLTLDAMLAQQQGSARSTAAATAAATASTTAATGTAIDSANGLTVQQMIARAQQEFGVCGNSSRDAPLQLDELDDDVHNGDYNYNTAAGAAAAVAVGSADSYNSADSRFGELYSVTLAAAAAAAAAADNSSNAISVASSSSDEACSSLSSSGAARAATLTVKALAEARATSLRAQSDVVELKLQLETANRRIEVRTPFETHTLHCTRCSSLNLVLVDITIVVC